MLTDHHDLGATLLAINTAGDASCVAPDWVQLLPAGPQVVGVDGRAWTLDDPDALVAAANAAGRELVFDVEHATQIKAPKGEPAPAVGWIKEVARRADGIWARVAWNAEGARLIAEKAYRYLSPVFRHDAAGRIRALVSAGLTNSPNLDLVALNAAVEVAPSTQETDMDANVLEALGLKPTATAADALTAIATLKEARDTALNRAQTPDPEKFVPKADHQIALNRIGAFEAAEKARLDAEIVATVEAAVADGKIKPVSKEYHLAACRAEGGFERFKAEVAKWPAETRPTGLERTVPLPSDQKAEYVAMNAAQQTAFISAKARELIAAEKAKGAELELGVAINRVMETLK